MHYFPLNALRSANQPIDVRWLLASPCLYRRSCRHCSCLPDSPCAGKKSTSKSLDGFASKHSCQLRTKPPHYIVFHAFEMLNECKLCVIEGRLGFLTQQQAEVLEAFKQAIRTDPSVTFNSLRHTDHLCLQFLRARAFNLKDAMAMFVACERWREENQVTALISFRLPTEIAVKMHFLYPRYYHKTDGWGRPVYYESLANFDHKAIFSLVTDDDLFKCHIASYEHLYRVRYPACSAAFGRHIEDTFIVLDCHNAPVMQVNKIYALVSKISDISKNYYPECMFRMYIINAPMMFTGAYACFKPFLDSATKKKIHVLGSSYSKTLLEFIPPENLPHYYGGTCKCSEGCMNSDEGPWKAHFQDQQAAAPLNNAKPALCNATEISDPPAAS